MNNQIGIFRINTTKFPTPISVDATFLYRNLLICVPVFIVFPMGNIAGKKNCREANNFKVSAKNPGMRELAKKCKTPRILKRFPRIIGMLPGFPKIIGNFQDLAKIAGFEKIKHHIITNWKWNQQRGHFLGN